MDGDLMQRPESSVIAASVFLCVIGNDAGTVFRLDGWWIFERYPIVGIVFGVGHDFWFVEKGAVLAAERDAAMPKNQQSKIGVGTRTWLDWRRLSLESDHPTGGVLKPD
jgi:hypothetical protein